MQKPSFGVCLLLGWLCVILKLTDIIDKRYFMSIWEILGIEYTTDKEAIKKAYRAKLSVTNPEDDQEAFIQLRRAYEDAVEQADRAYIYQDSFGFFDDDDEDEEYEEYEAEEEEEEEEIIRPIYREQDDDNSDDEFRKLKNIDRYWRNRGNYNKENKSRKELAKDKLSALYNSYSKRVNPNCWSELFKDELFMAGDITDDTFAVFMKFIIEKYYLPKVVWKVIVDHFNIVEQRENLVADYSENIIDMMISNASYEDKNNILNESEYASLRDNYLELLEINPYDKSAMSGMMKANSALMEQYVKLMDLEPDNKRVKIELARCYFYNFQYEEALELLEDLNPIREDMCDYYHIQGMVFYKMKKYEQSLEIFLKWKNFLEGVAYHTSRVDYIHELKKFGYVNYLIGECYLELKDYEQASAVIEKNLSRNHRDKVRINESKCKLYFREGKFPLCISTCEDLLKDVEDNYVAYLYLARTYFYMVDYDNTVFYANKAKEMCVYLPQPYHLLARLYIATEQLDKATEILDEFKELTIYSDGVAFYEAQIMYFRGKYEEAYCAVDKLISRYNARTSDYDEFKQLLLLKAECQIKLNRINDAINSYERILDIDPNDPIVNAKIAYSYETKAKELGNYMENMAMAVKYMERQMEIYAFSDAIFHLGRFYEAVNRVFDAIKAYLKCLEIDEVKYGRDIYGPLMELYRRVDSLEDAIYCANKRIEFADTEDEKKSLYISLGCFYEGKNKLQSAQETYMEYESMFGKSIDVSAYYARTIYRQGKTEESVKLLEALVRDNSYDDKVKIAYMILCEIYGDIGNLKAAKGIYEHVVAKNIVDCQVPASLAEAYFKNKRYEKARKYYLIAHNKDTEDKYSYLVNLCELYSENTFLYSNLLAQELNKVNMKRSNAKYRGDLITRIKYSRLTKRFRIAQVVAKEYRRVQRCPNCPYEDCHKLLFEIGRFNEKNGHQDLAIIWFDRALEANPDNVYYKKYIEAYRKKYKKGE